MGYKLDAVSMADRTSQQLLLAPSYATRCQPCCFESTMKQVSEVSNIGSSKFQAFSMWGLFTIRDRLDSHAVQCVGLHGEGRDTCCADFNLPSSGSFLGVHSRGQLGGAYSPRILCTEGCKSKGRRTGQRPPRLSNRTKSWIAMMTMPLKKGDDRCFYQKVIITGVLGLLLWEYE